MLKEKWEIRNPGEGGSKPEKYKQHNFEVKRFYQNSIQYAKEKAMVYQNFNLKP